MLALAGINAVAAVVFASVYAAAATRVLAQWPFLASLGVLFVVFTAFWVRVERSRGGGRDPISRFGRIVAGLLVVMIAFPALVLMPLFGLQRQLPAEAGVDTLIAPVMVLVLWSLVLVSLVNVAGTCIVAGSALWRRLRRP